MDVELRLRYMVPQMHIEQINIFVKLGTTDLLIEQVSKIIQLQPDQFSLFIYRFGYQIRIVHGWEFIDVEPLDILSIKLLDPNIKFTLDKEKQKQQIDYSSYFFQETHNNKQINLYDDFIEKIKSNKIDYVQKHINKQIANQINNEGWTILHWICYFGKLDILKIIIPYIQDINQITYDGWSSLMISIRQQHISITKYLLDQDNINIDLCTQQSSALHIACRMENTKLIEMLQEKNVNFLIQDQQNNNVFQIASLKMQLFLLGLVNKIQLVTEIQLFSQINPFIAKGTYYSPGTRPWTVKQRYLVINPQADHIIRYQDSTQQELRESIKLSQIQSIDTNYTSFKLKKGYYYIQICGDNKSEIIIGLQTAEQLSRWSSLIKKGMTFVRNIASGLQMNNIFIKLEEIDLDEQPNISQSKRESQAHIKRKISDLSALMPKLTHQIPKFKDFILKSLLINDPISCIFKAYCELDGSVYGLKCINKKVIIEKNLLKEAIQEVQVLTTIKNPFIIQLQYAFQTPNYLYMAFEHCNGGSLFSILQVLERITEEQAKYYLSQVLFALEYLHSQNIVYNNISRQNVLLTSKGSIKLIGLQNYGYQSIYYKTPEYLDEQKIGKWTDYYQFGILAYELISGCHPFHGETTNQIIMSILVCKIQFSECFSEEAKNLITKLTHKNYEKRINFEEVRQHPFFKDTDWELYLTQKYKNPIRLNQLRNYLKLEKITFQDDDYDLHLQSNFRKIANYDYIRNNQ